MEVTFEIKADGLLAALTVTERQLPYVWTNAINATLKTIQSRVREHTLESFIVRRRPFILRQVAYIGREDFARAPHRATRGRISVRQRERLLLNRFEQGGVRGPWTPGAANVAVPVRGSETRRQKASRVPKSLTFESLNLRRQGKRVIGEQGTYVVPKVGVFRRRGRTSRLIYAFVPTVDLPARLAFHAIANVTAASMFPVYARAEINEAIKHSMVKLAKSASVTLASAVVSAANRMPLAGDIPGDDSDWGSA